MPYALSNRKGKPVQIYYEDIPNPEDPDAPVIVMHHGDGNDSQDWKSLGYVDKLTQAGYRLILIDYLGYGQSDKRIKDPDAYTMPHYAGDTIAVLDQLNIRENAIFFGGSMGGTLGYEIATTPKYASYFQSFIINGMAPIENTVILAFGQWANEGGMEHVVAEMDKVMAAPFPDAVRKTFLANDPDIYAIANSRPWPAYPAAKLQDIDKPVLLACGGNSLECADVTATAEIIPGAQLAIIPNKDHGQAYWHADEMVPLILKFIGSTLSERSAPRAKL